MDDSTWRSKVTAVKVDATTLTSGQYSITAGKLTINQGVITTTGNKTITIVATGYNDSSITQNITAGAFSAAQSTLDLTSGIPMPGGSPTYKLAARDQYGNKIANYQFKLKLAAKNDGQVPGTINEVVTVNNNAYTMPTTTGTNQLVVVDDAHVGVTDATNGEVTVAIHYFGDGIQGTDWNIGDAVGPVWYDAAGNEIFN